jgi:hypothetical protein
MPFSFELVHQTRDITGVLGRQPLLQFGERESLAHQERVQGRLDTSRSFWWGISHGCSRSKKIGTKIGRRSNARFIAAAHARRPHHEGASA